MTEFLAGEQREQRVRESAKAIRCGLLHPANSPSGYFSGLFMITIVENLRAPYLANRVVIQDYDPRWPQMFEMLRSRITIVLNGVAHSIEHVGSTAVPA